MSAQQPRSQAVVTTGVAALAAAMEEGGIDHGVVVAASGLEALYLHFERQERLVFATREEEAVAIAAGLVLAGAAPAVLMQQSGVGNALNAVLTLADAYGIRFPIVVFDRGPNDENPVQRASSIWTGVVLAALGGVDVDISRPGAADALLDQLRLRRRWIRVQG